MSAIFIGLHVPVPRSIYRWRRLYLQLPSRSTLINSPRSFTNCFKSVNASQACMPPMSHESCQQDLPAEIFSSCRTAPAPIERPGVCRGRPTAETSPARSTDPPFINPVFWRFLTSNVCLFRLHLSGRITNAICDLPDVPLRIIETVFNPATTIFYGISPVSQVRSIAIHIYHQYALWLNYPKTVGVLTLNRFATP